MQKFNFIQKLAKNVSSKAKRNVTKDEIVFTLIDFAVNTIFSVCMVVVFLVVCYGIYFSFSK